MDRVTMARPIIGDEERAAVDRVLVSGGLAQGPEVAAFEQEFAEWVGGRSCIAVNSGTSALHLALLALGIGPGDEVIVPSFTFAASANAVALCGAIPVFADIDPLTFCLDPAAAAAAVTPRTAAIMAVHLYGQAAETGSLRAVTSRHGLALVEDAAQAHGATDMGEPAGALGAAAAFSFYPTKNMTTGEGGMVVLDDDAAVRRVRMLRNQGMERRYENELVGFNLRMTDLAAAIGRVQLTRLAGFNERRRAVAAAYDAGLGGIVGTPAVAAGAVPVYHQYTIRVAGRDAVAERLAARGVETAVYYPIPVHRLAPFAGATHGDLPATETAAREVLSLPMHPRLDDDQVERVVDAVRAAVEAAA